MMYELNRATVNKLRLTAIIAKHSQPPKKVTSDLIYSAGGKASLHYGNSDQDLSNSSTNLERL